MAQLRIPEQTNGQQPMSLVTVASPTTNTRRRWMQTGAVGTLASGTESELLTLRILEASERKMKLIKKLLSPEDFNSLSSDLFVNNLDSLRGGYSEPPLIKSSTTPREQDDFNLKSSTLGASSRSFTKLKRSISKSESILHRPSGQNPRDASTNLIKKRQAIEFFFNDSLVVSQNRIDRPTTGTNELITQSRAGLFLITDDEDNQAVVQVESIYQMLYNFLLGILMCIGFNCSFREANSETSSTSDDEYNQIVSQKYDICAPYSRASNLQIMKRRLRADRQYDKLLVLSRPKKWTSTTVFEYDSLSSFKLTISPNDTFKHKTNPDLHNLIKRHKWKKPDGYGYGLNVTESKILQHHRLVQALSKFISGTRDSNSLINDIDLHLFESKSKIEFTLDKVELVKHRWMSQEEQAALKLRDLFDNYSQSRSEFCSISQKLVQIVKERYEMSFSNLERLINICLVRVDLFKKLQILQQEVLAKQVELESIRNEQQFKTTTIGLESSGKTNGLSSPTLIENLKNFLAKQVDIDVDKIESLSNQCQQLQNYEETMMANFEEIRIINAEDIDKSANIPLSEKDRQHKLLNWCKSLRFVLIIKNLLANEVRLQVDSAQRDQMDGRYTLKFRLDKAIKSDCPVQSINQIEVQVRAATKNLYNLGQTTFGSSSFALEPTSSRYSLTIDSSAPVAEQIKLNITTCISSIERKQIIINSSQRFSPKTQNLINSLYNAFFRSKHPFDNVETKLSKLLNRIDLMGLYSLHHVDQAASASLSPHLRSFKLYPREHDRHRLLAWRWTQSNTANGNQVVYLTNRENRIQYNLDSNRQNVSRLAADITIDHFSDNRQKQVDGYKMIELTRRQAQEYIQHCETHILELLNRSRREQLNQSSVSTSFVSGSPSNKLTTGVCSPMRAKEILSEPKMTQIRLPSLARSLAYLMPRKTARRPLMPRRYPLSRQTRHHNQRLANLLSLGLGGIGGNPLQNSLLASSTLSNLHNSNSNLKTDSLKNLPSELDIEHQFVDRWKKFSKLKGANDGASKGNQLRLIVSIQQALNVPMRLTRVPLQTRSNSPYPGSAGSPHPGAALLTSSALAGSRSTAQQIYLTDPTTYVEVIFQRKQLTSSLAHGSNPAWNESLTFAIDLHDTTSDIVSSPVVSADSRIQTSQLVDEYLQLNLYDCRTTTVSGPVSGGGFLEQSSTLQMLSGASIGNQLSSSSPAFGNISQSTTQQVVAAHRQRIERYLLGSLRIPMTTLLSSGGRIQGSFVLAQPILLDEYQHSAFNQQLLDQEQQQISILHRPTIQHQLPETLINLFIALDPPIMISSSMGSLDPLIHMALSISGRESSHLSRTFIEYARIWEQIMASYAGSLKSAKTSGPSNNLAISQFATGTMNPISGQQSRLRHIKVLVLHDDASPRLICSLIGSLKPPEQLLELDGNGTDGDLTTATADDSRSILTFNFQEKMHILARFVSLLSPLKYGLLQMRSLAPVLWFNCKQLIENHLGGDEERAVLLCNYFLYIGKCSALILGESITKAKCVFVLVWHEQSRFIEQQLELQVSDLMDTIQNTINPVAVGGDGQDNSSRGASKPQRQPFKSVTSLNFIHRLPIVINSRTVQLWDPASGKSYMWNDVGLPLISVGSIVTCENVYANIQLNDSPNEINYDIRLRQFWSALVLPSLGETTTTMTRPSSTGASNSESLDLQKFFKTTTRVNIRRQFARLELVRKQIPRPISESLVDHPSMELIDYRQFDAKQCLELKANIEKAIKSHLFAWRTDRPTYFNRTLSRIIEKKLATFERTQLNSNGTTRNRGTPPSWRIELGELIRSEVLLLPNNFRLGDLGDTGGDVGGESLNKKIVSWPANMPYTSMQSIIDGLYASGIHNADLMLDNLSTSITGLSNSMSIQFLLACHVEPYPAHVMSVWLYVGALLNAQ